MTEALIGFGANLSNPKRNFLAAVERLEASGARVIARSGLWSSPAWPAGSGQPDYVNAAAKVEFEGTAAELLSILQMVETELGRVRTVRNAARTLDLDLLIFGDEPYESERLTLPHPRMFDRAFVLLPLCELDAVWLGPLAKLPRVDIDAMHYLGGW